MKTSRRMSVERLPGLAGLRRSGRLLPIILCFWFVALPALLNAASGDGTGQKVEIVGGQDANRSLRSGSVITVSFPAAMVKASDIDVEMKTSPLRFDPPVTGAFIWKSQTEGEFHISKIQPGREFKIGLVPGLVDLEGGNVKQNDTIAAVRSQPFMVSTYFGGGPLAKRPSVPLRFSHAVRPSDLLDTAWFQDRDSRQHHPLEVILDDDSGKAVNSLTVTPREDLPGGRTFDLVIDGLKEAETDSSLDKLQVIPLGDTEAVRVVKAAAFNYPLHRRRITVEFNTEVDPVEGRKIRIDPPVPDVECRPDGESLWLEGSFDIAQRYRVTVPAGIQGQNGFATVAESRWTATFHPKKPAIIFPSEDLHQRSRLGLNFAFMQVNTGPLEWKLARVPPEKLLAIHSRLREFTEEQVNPVTNEPENDPATGFPIWTKSELLIDASRLETVAQGRIDASPDEADTRREIVWKPENGMPAGAYVLEVTGKNPEGKTIANRALITFTEYAAVQKQFQGTRLLRVVNVADGRSVPGVRIKAVNSKNEFLAEAVTDRDGKASFKMSAIFPAQGERAKRFLFETPDGPMLQPVETDQYRGSGCANFNETEKEGDAFRIVVAADRPIYRPGQTVKFKGFVREIGRDRELRIPKARQAAWTVTDDQSEERATGTAKIDDYGGFEGEWKIPENSKLATCSLEVNVQGATASDRINVQEFRPPPFQVALQELKLPGAQSGVRISSVYFHGAPNASARVKWTASWTGRANGESDVIMTDKPRLVSSQTSRQQEVTGEGTLGADGTLEVKTSPPFTDNIPRAWYDVSWTAEVTAADGQTITEEKDFSVYAVPMQLQVNGSQTAQKPGRKENPLAITIKADAKDPAGNSVAQTPVRVEIYKVDTKTVKEQISPNVYRYRNSTAFEKLQTVDGRAPFEKETPVPAVGEYLLAVRNPENAAIPAGTGRVYVAGNGNAEFSVQDEESIGVTCDKGTIKSGTDNACIPGEKAVVFVQSPFPGVAWVTVEAESVLDTFIIPLENNSSRFELPVKKEYAPNAWISVHLLRCAGESLLPAERFGSVQFFVRRPDQELKVTPVLAAKQVRPGDMVAGEIVVTSEGRPVAKADLTVYAVDESILDAGSWHEPPLRQGMYPDRIWRVGTFHGLEQLSAGVDTASLHQKGFIVGAGVVSKAVAIESRVTDLRTNFPPLAFWQTHLQSDRNGRVPFSFKAPDALTKYRVIALGQTKQSQFGTGSDWVEISKPVQVEPALPRFLRVGDTVELRAIVRQKVADELPITLKCTTGLHLNGGPALTQTVKRGLPAVFRFSATVGEISSAPVRFETNAVAGGGDAVEITLPVHPPTLLRREAVFGRLDEMQKDLPKNWQEATGTAEITVSTSPWLPKLTGLPLLLDYPHGCFEQITSRVLGYTVLANLLDYLPQPASREAAYRKRIEDGIGKMSANLTTGGYLPYWPGGPPHNLPTIAGYWAVKSMASRGMDVPASLRDSLGRAVRAIALGDKKAPGAPFDRAYALMVLSPEKDAKTFAPAIREMYLRREKFDEESRALLAIAMRQFGVMPGEQVQLLSEIDRPLEERAFDPDTFSSTTREEAIRALAFAIIDPAGANGKARNDLRERINSLLDSSQSLSTQENFWLLMAFKAMHDSLQGARADFRAASPAPGAISRNGASALWPGLDIRRLHDFALRMDRADSLACLMQAVYRSDSPVTGRTDRGLRVERVVRNLTDKSRTGEEGSPFRIGDQILITYRIVSPKLHHFVALEDELPAALETVNPDIASIARTYSIPQAADTRQLDLSYSELHDRMTCLYFNIVEPGAASYSVLARATSAGVFHWPATQVEPMYDSRFSGLSPSSVCHVVGDH